VSSEVQTEKRFEKLLGRFSNVLMPGALLVFFVPFIGLLFYASLNTDDYAKATLSYNCAAQPAFRTMTGMAWVAYSQGSGRWVTSFIQSIALNKFNLITSYGWLLLFVMVSNVLALAYFLANFFRVHYAKGLLAGGIFYAIWLASTASPIEGVYWLTEAFEYQFTLTTLLILAGLLCKSRQKVLSYIALAVLAIAIPGQHEITGVSLLAFLFVGVVASRVLKLPTFQWWLCFGLGLASFAAIMLSPGMAAKFAVGHSIPWDLAHTLPYARRALGYGAVWVVNPVVLVGALSLTFVLRPRQDPAVGISFLPPKWLAVVGVAGMGFLLFEFAAMEKSSGYGVFGPRAIGWTQFMFWLLMICSIVIGVPEISKFKFSRTSQMAIYGLFLLCLFGTGQFRSAVKDLRGPAREWHVANVARLNLRGSTVLLEQLPPKPRLFSDTSLANDSGCWVNQCMAVYLGADKVSVKGSPENSWINGCDGKR
jgi:hypothetical protein